MGFREIGKALRELWACIVVCLFIIADYRGDFDGTWIDTAASVASILLFAWLVFFAIGVSRGEPNP